MSTSKIAETRLAAALRAAREVLARYRDKPLNEQNTKGSLIEPMLEALGWNVRDPAEVDREYGNRARDNPVDYALLANGSPRLFVEAKGMGKDLADRKFASQVVSYATVAGAAWVVLTNGEEWRVYKALAEVDLEEKLLFAVRITDAGEVAEGSLRLLAKDKTAENPLEALWRMHHVDRQVGDALRGVLREDAANGVVSLLRKLLPKLSPTELRASYRRFELQVRYQAPTNVAEATRTGGGRALRIADGGKVPAKRKRVAVDASLADLIEAGVVKPPLALLADYLGKRVEARVEADARVTFENDTYDSLSAAGEAARRKALGPKAKSMAVNTNGWTFWKSAGADGRPREIGELRKEWIAARTSDGSAARKA